MKCEMIDTLAIRQPEKWLYEIRQKGVESTCYVMVPNANVCFGIFCRKENIFFSLVFLYFNMFFLDSTVYLSIPWPRAKLAKKILESQNDFLLSTVKIYFRVF